MKKIVLSLFVIAAMTSLQANAFDVASTLKFWDRATEAQTAQEQTTKTLADIQTQMTTIDKSVQDAFISIASELSTRREVKSIKSDLKANSENLATVISTYTAKMANDKDNFTKKISKLSTKEKTALVNNLATLSEDAQQYLLLATDGIRTASTALKNTQKLSEFATTVTNINNVAGQLKRRATTVINLANQAKSIAQAAGVTVQ